MMADGKGMVEKKRWRGRESTEAVILDSVTISDGKYYEDREEGCTRNKGHGRGAIRSYDK
jgi:hypothetical protein